MALLSKVAGIMARLDPGPQAADEAITRLELRTDDERVLDAFDFPEPLPFGVVYPERIWLHNPEDSGAGQGSSASARTATN